MSRIVALSLVTLLGFTAIARAQPANRSSARVTVTWTVAGAGAGFGVGLWAGLTAFDDAVNSDRKVWASALAGAAIGGVTGYLIGRARQSRSPVTRVPMPPMRFPMGHPAANEMMVLPRPSD